MAFDLYRENRGVGLIHLTNLRTRIQFFNYNIAYIMLLYTTFINYYLLYIITICVAWTINSCSD